MRPFVHGILTALVNSNLWIAFGAASLTASTQWLLPAHSFHLPLFVFFATVPAYYYMRIMKWMSSSEAPSNEVYLWTKKYRKPISRFNFVMTVGALWSFSQLGLSTKLGLVVPALVVFFYSFPHKGKNVGIRQFPGLKLLIISVVWVWITWLLPWLESDLPFEMDLLWHGVQRLLFIMALIIPFDIRDLELDHPQMRTLPQLIGVEKSRNIAWMLLAFYDLSLLIQFFSSSFLSLPVLIALLIPSELLALLIYFSTSKKEHLFYAFLLDGVFLLWWPLLFLSQFF